MKDELISLETAKLAKEKGFHFINNDPDNFVGFYHENVAGVQLFNYYSVQGYPESLLKHKNTYTASTQSLLQRWLREEHNIHVWSEHKATYYFPRVNSYNKGNGVGLKYEEALEEGLYEGLKLIKP